MLSPLRTTSILLIGTLAGFAGNVHAQKEDPNIAPKAGAVISVRLKGEVNWREGRLLESEGCRLFVAADELAAASLSGASSGARAIRFQDIESARVKVEVNGSMAWAVIKPESLKALGRCRPLQ
jgi:sarcosine oxidase gamma subunit